MSTDNEGKISGRPNKEGLKLHRLLMKYSCGDACNDIGIRQFSNPDQKFIPLPTDVHMNKYLRSGLDHIMYEPMIFNITAFDRILKNTTLIKMGDEYALVCKIYSLLGVNDTVLRRKLDKKNQKKAVKF